MLHPKMHIVTDHHDPVSGNAAAFDTIADGAVALARQVQEIHGFEMPQRHLLARITKRGFDITLAAISLIALAPVFAILALIIRRDGGPAFFRHPRVGMHGHLFDCYKFRSMVPDAQSVLAQHINDNPRAALEWRQYQKLKNDIRITPFGRFIRRTSLDELPQLINVLKGDMSFVGPRPCTPDQEDFYAKDFGYYESVRPGITGPWQVGGRNKLSFQQRVQLESRYVRNWSLNLDIAILFKTIPTLFKKDQAF